MRRSRQIDDSYMKLLPDAVHTNAWPHIRTHGRHTVGHTVGHTVRGGVQNMRHTVRQSENFEISPLRHTVEKLQQLDEQKDNIK